MYTGLLPFNRLPSAAPLHIIEPINRIEAAITDPVIPDRRLDLIRECGMEPDWMATHDFRDAFQAALDKLAAAGGGTLHVRHPLSPDTWMKPTVIYRIRGGIEVHSRTRILIDRAVRIFFECDPQSYTRDGKGVLIRYEGTTVYGHQPLVRSCNATDIVIEAADGFGAMPEIDGDGEAWLRWEMEEGIGPSFAIRDANNAGLPLRDRAAAWPHSWYRRPSMLHFFLCNRVRVENIKLANAPFWVVHPVFSQKLVFRGLLFDCQNVNNDGIDVDSCREVLIEDVIFNNHDDNVVLKSGRDLEGREGVDIAGTELDDPSIRSPYLKDGRLGGPTEDVVVRRCAFKGHYAIAAGSEMSGDVRRVYAIDNLALQRVEMLVFVKSCRKRGGTVEQLFVHGLRAGEVHRDVIALIPNYDGDTESPHVPCFRDIHLSDISVKAAGRAITVEGWKEQPISGVHLTDVAIGEVKEGEDNIFNVSGVQDLQVRNVFIGERKFDGRYTVEAQAAPRFQN